MFVLIHSPLVGAFTWSIVANELRRRGKAVLVPHLHDDETASVAYWKQHAESVARELELTPSDTRLILVGHSGAGPLLPAIRAYSPREGVGYIFADAGILWKDASRLELLAAEDASMARAFEEQVRGGAKFPTWSSDDLRELVPDDAARKALVRDLNPRGLAFFQETLRAFTFPNAPCAYLQFNSVYETYAQQAREHGWLFRNMRAGHFHMLVEPVAVTDALIELAQKLETEQRT